MVSGKYSALSGAVAREQAMSNIAANLANVNATGFKKDRVSFSSILRGVKQQEDARGINYTRIRKIGTDFSQGGMIPTGRPMDVAIDGEGFFKIRKNNEIYYTRAGHFMVDENGMVKTEDGYNVLSGGNEPLQLDTNGMQDILIDDTGNISINGVLSGARLQTFAVNETDKLIKAGGTFYKLDEGASDQPMETFRVVQGSLESSNVNMMEEMTAMITTQRSFEAHHKVLESYSKLGEKLDELGTVG